MAHIMAPSQSLLFNSCGGTRGGSGHIKVDRRTCSGEAAFLHCPQKCSSHFQQSFHVARQNMHVEGLLFAKLSNMCQCKRSSWALAQRKMMFWHLAKQLACYIKSMDKHVLYLNLMSSLATKKQWKFQLKLHNRARENPKKKQLRAHVSIIYIQSDLLNTASHLWTLKSDEENNGGSCEASRSPAWSSLDSLCAAPVPVSQQSCSPHCASCSSHSFTA